MAVREIEITTGDAVGFIVTLMLNGVAISIPDTATVRAMIINEFGTLEADVEQFDSNTSANWPLGIVGVVMASGDTENLTPCLGTLEIEMTDASGPHTWHWPITIKEGH